MKRWLLALAPLAIGAAEPRDFTIAGQAFGTEDILDARAQPDVAGGVSIMITLSDGAARRFTRLPQAPTSVSWNGKLLPSETVADGTIMLRGSFALPEAEAIAKSIAGKPPLPDSLSEDF